MPVPALPPLPPAPSLGGLATAWTAAPGGLLLTAVLGVLYVRASRRREWPARRSAAFGAGLALLLLTTCGWLGAYARALSWVYTTQVVVLLFVVPVLLAYGRPLALLGPAHPVRRLARRLGHPLLGPLLVPVALALVFFTPVYGATLRHLPALALLQIALVLLGLGIAAGLLGDESDRDTSGAVGAAVAIGFLELLLDAIPGIVLRLRTHVLDAPYWSALHRPYGGTPLVDQQHAGAVLWFVAEAADLPFLVILVRRWIRTDEREAARVDAELDAELAARPVSAAEIADPAAPELLRPWWETDPDRIRGHRATRPTGRPTGRGR